ncbi:hypothetical protein ROR02_01510 [Pararhodospirillum oryzae]|uniref:ABC transporter substrate-binding protein n=1 Tax=Pararhodospirillum oryzae TaxID=478448 RepID=A0A512H3Q1_9PROT|nr:hypothetical protein ROR02_01510 [Pararhodospirillum oryzae]
MRTGDLATPSPVLSGDAKGARGWDVLGQVPVPLRHRVRAGVEDLLRARALAGDPPLRVSLPLGQGGRGPFERLAWIRDLDAYPRLLVSSAGANTFNRRFHARHVETGAFEGAQPEGVAAPFVEAGLIDPKGWIGVYALAPYVLLIDHARLGPRPVPRRWADLMEPCYQGQVVFSGWRPEGTRKWRAFNTFLLLCFALDHGREGVARLVRNVPTLLHSTQMPRVAGTDASPGGIHVLPWAQASLCPRPATTSIVWPEDGALAYPLWLTRQRAHARRVAALTDHFHGPALARILDENLYPALCPGRAPRLPAGARLRWPGWEAVRHPASARDLRAACALFHEAAAGQGGPRPCA